MSSRLIIDVARNERDKISQVSIYFVKPPPEPGQLLSRFLQAFGDTRMTGYVAFKDPSTDSTVTSRPVGITINGGPETIVDCFAGEQSYQCNAGDSILLASKGDVNPAGPGPAGPPLSVTASVTGGGGQVPPMPGELTSRFTEP